MVTYFQSFVCILLYMCNICLHMCISEKPIKETYTNFTHQKRVPLALWQYRALYASLEKQRPSKETSTFLTKTYKTDLYILHAPQREFD